MKNDDLEFDWPDTGKLTVRFDSPRSAVLSYCPSMKAVIRHLLEAAQSNKTQDCQKVTPITKSIENEATAEPAASQGARPG